MDGDRRKFNGSDSLRETHIHLQSIAGNATWVNEFETIEYERKQFFDRLLLELFKQNVCCAIVGTFPAFRAGIFSSFNNVTLAIANTKDPFLEKIIQRNGGPHNSFWVGAFNFLRESLGITSIEYTVKYEDITIPFLVQPVATSKHCGRDCNLNLVYYVLENFSFLACRKYAIVLLKRLLFKQKSSTSNITERRAMVELRTCSAIAVFHHLNA